MNIHTDSINKLMAEFARLPGIGTRTAERLAYYVLKQPVDEAMKLAEAISDVKTRIRYCERCFNLSEEPLCNICRNQQRDHSIICIVEQHKDLINLEETGKCNWVYHVLLGHLAPLEGITPDDLTIDALIKRVRAGNISEIVMATNPNLDGDGTALYISSLLSGLKVKITRLARGLPTGGSIEFANKEVLSEAITRRILMD
ncbi:MAG: recombination protein RecR [Sedimentisphaerales bacterium]|nr:recombination protein RecR [Sedimentisphaerales bacterium]MBN2842964.1 recombination protein RecR [Sedimentisphaerales bacterium]